MESQEEEEKRPGVEFGPTPKLAVICSLPQELPAHDNYSTKLLNFEAKRFAAVSSSTSPSHSFHGRTGALLSSPPLAAMSMHVLPSMVKSRA